jgi:1,4-dihydroxy-2-naphthoyl-CoA synthase
MDLESFKNHTVNKISELRVSDEGQEGLNAFLEKRKSKWS